MLDTNQKSNWNTKAFGKVRLKRTTSGRLSFSVAFKIIIGIIAIMIVLATVQIVYSYRATSLNLQQEAEHTLLGYYQTYETAIETEKKNAEALAISIADRKDVQELYMSGDRDELYALLSPMFEQWKERQVVHLYIENPDGTVFLRVHNPTSYGDDITYRATALTALQEQRVTSGVEMGPNRIGVRAVAPIYSAEGTTIGMVEVGLDFDEAFIEGLKSNTGADFTMWVTYESAKIPQLKPIEGSPKAPINEMFYYASTDPTVPQADSGIYQSVLETGETEFVIISKNKTVPTMVYVTQILGYNNKVLGLIQVSQPYTEHIASQNNAFLTSLALVGGLTIFSMLVIWFIISRLVLQPLSTLTRFAEKQTAGETNARVTLNSGDEFEQLSGAFNTLAESVEQERRTLELQVADRTKALQTSAEVTRRLAAVTNPRQLAVDVVEEVQTSFNYYHAHIYFVDEATGDLLMAGGTGEAGATMLARGHKVAKGRGLVGRAAETNKTVLVPDVTQSEGWLPNPLLPDTKSEVAIPISAGKQVLGVLDVQQNVVNGLGEEDAQLLQALAGQVAISLQNARTFEESRAKAELESLVNAIGQKIQRAGSLEETLQTATRELGMALGAKRVRASITNHQNDGKDADA